MAYERQKNFGKTGKVGITGAICLGVLCFSVHGEALTAASLGNFLSTGDQISPHSSLVHRVQSQDSSKERSVFNVDNVSGQSGQRLAIRIDLPVQNFSKKASLMFQGFPNEVLLFPGSRVNDVWIVPLIDVPELTMISPHNFEGASQITVILNEENNRIVEAQKFSLEITSKKSSPAITQEFGSQSKPGENKTKTAASQAVEKPVEQPKPQKAKLTNADLTTQSLASVQPQESKEAAIQSSLSDTSPSDPSQNVFKPKPGLTDQLRTVMMEKAENLLAQGDIEGARVNLRFIAERGDMEAALLLAKTFDPVEFKKYNAVGLQPDPAQAKLWYERALQMGSPKAQQYLQAMSSAKE